MQSTWTNAYKGCKKAAASFVLGKYARTADVLSLNWLPIKKQREWNTLKVTYIKRFTMQTGQII